MRTLQTDDKNDLMLDASGNLSIVSGTNAVKQASVNFAKTIRSEKMYEMDSGVLYWPTTFVTVNIGQFRHSLREQLLRTPNVQEVISLSVQQNGDQINYEATLRESLTGASVSTNG